jgi:hypothetical protein
MNGDRDKPTTLNALTVVGLWNTILYYAAPLPISLNQSILASILLSLYQSLIRLSIT